MTARSGKAWFYAQGQAMRSRGLDLKLSWLWPHRNQMPTWAWYAFTSGYEGWRCGIWRDPKRTPAGRVPTKSEYQFLSGRAAKASGRVPVICIARDDISDVVLVTDEGRTLIHL